MAIADELTFRDCNCFDWRRVASLIAELFPLDRPSAIAYAVRTEFIRLCFLYEDVVGFYAFRPGSSDGELWLDYIGVRSGARRRGLGRRLLADLEDQASKRGFCKLALAVDADNADAIQLYESHGFKRLVRASDLSRLTYSKTIELPPGLEHYKSRRLRPPFDLLTRAYRKLLYWIFVGRDQT